MIPSTAAAVAALLALPTERPSLIVAPAVENERPTVEVTSTTVSGWHAGDAGYGDLFERLNLTTSLGSMQLGLRGDSASFIRPPSPAVAGRYTLEKIWLTWTGRSLELVAGDAYISFGRGLALSLRKVDELGLDTTLRGVKALVHGDRMGGTLAAGITNTNNVDEASGKSIDDPRDAIAAARVELTTPNGITLGAHGTAVAFHHPLSLAETGNYDDRYLQFGPTIDAPRLTDWLGIYLEGIGQIRRTEADPGGSPAYGAYGAATADFGRIALLMEGKAYGALAPVKPRVERPEFATIAYNNPPTVERLLQILENPQRDIVGGRLRVEWRATPDISFYVNGGLFHDAQGYADPTRVGDIVPGTIYDPYVGLEARAPDGRSWLLASAGSRLVFLNGSQVLVRRDSHLEVDAARSLGGSWSATLHAIHEERLKYESALLNRHFREGTTLLGVRRSPWGSVAIGYDYTTDPTQPRRDYWNGNAEWNITASSSVRLFVGGTRGGLRCVSGVCRVFPPFEGVKVSATIRF